MAVDVGATYRWVIEQWQYLHGRKPTEAELKYYSKPLLDGVSRTVWMRNAEAQQAEAAVKRIFMDATGKPPNAYQLQRYSDQLRRGKLTRKKLSEMVAASPAALLREKNTTTDDSENEDALSYLKSVLDDYGLGNLGDWAWKEIQAGHSTERILQDLRQQDDYKKRFAGLELRKAAGLPAISEAEYIAYETDVRQMMRAAGLPADFYDTPDDFASFIGKDVSVSEMQSRINEGYLAASQAPPEVRNELKRLYGVTEGDLAAYFLDPDRALPVLQKQFGAASVSGTADRTGYGTLTQGEAESLAALGVTEGDAQQGFAALVQSKELFGALPGEGADNIDRATQQAAVFGGDAAAMSTIERRAKERVSQGSGAQSFSIGQGGVAGLGE